MRNWIAVDLDGTLAQYDKWRGADHIGEPILPMVRRVKEWIAQGKDVRIFTARMSSHAPDNKDNPVDIVTPIQTWCEKHIGRALPVTNVKDMHMIELWDDIAVRVIQNTGIAVRTEH